MEPQVISMRLETYDDLFSDFDIRPDSSRALSVDFTDEVKRAAHDKKYEGIELILHMPEQKRDNSREGAITERLAAHFKKHFRLLLQERRHITKLGISMIAMGILCMIGATFIIFEDPSRNLFLSFLVVFLEPAAWFLLWEGMDQAVFSSKDINPELAFYRKMSHPNGRIYFKSY